MNPSKAKDIQPLKVKLKLKRIETRDNYWYSSERRKRTSTGDTASNLTFKNWSTEWRIPLISISFFISTTTSLPTNVLKNEKNSILKNQNIFQKRLILIGCLAAIRVIMKPQYMVVRILNKVGPIHSAHHKRIYFWIRKLK